MRDYREHLINKDSLLKDSLVQLDKLAPDAILFVVDEYSHLLGSLTDGDVRRGLLVGKGLEERVFNYVQTNPKSIKKANYSIQEIIDLREQNFKVLPVLDEESRIVNVINFRIQKSYLPIDVLIMAGGRGSRLSPMTDTLPKPLLKVADKPIIDYNFDRLRYFGVDDFHISVRYLGDKIEDHFRQRNIRDVKINFIRENKPLGTLGAASLVEDFQNDFILVINSDLLTNIDFEDFFLDFLSKKADMSVVTIPYQVDIPYAVMETKNDKITSFKEKPTYTYYSNGGIYLVKRDILNRVPKNIFYNTTDLMEELISKGGNLLSYPNRRYWLDIGRPQDFEKAQLDVRYLGL